MSCDIYASVFENAQIGLIVLDKITGCVQEVNAAFLRMIGCTSAEIAGRSFWDLPLLANAGAEIRAQLLAGYAVTGVEAPLRTSDGRWLLLAVSGIALDGHIQLEIRDATGREQVRQSARVEALRHSAARTAAEFQALHRTLRDAAELLLINAAQGRPVLRELGEVQQASARASVIAEQLLAVSGKIELQARPVALNILVESMLPGLRQLFGPDIDVIADLKPETTPVMADPQQIAQVILKLAANSRDAMKPGGTFRIETGASRSVEPGLTKLTVPNGGPYGMLAMSDTGPGLDALSWANLYEPFFSTKPNGGLGLGLAAVQGIVRQSGGRLWVDSQPGEGTTFRIYLPVATGHPAEAECPTLSVPQMQNPPGDLTILLVEANDGMRTVMANILKKRGYRVVAAIDSPEALRIIEMLGLPDLLISRPEPELTMHLAHRQPNLRVLYLIGSGDSLPAELPRSSFLEKPFAPEALLTRVLELSD